jgi:hypothetical protein
LPSTLDKYLRLTSRPDRFNLEKQTLYSLSRRACGAQSWSGHFKEEKMILVRQLDCGSSNPQPKLFTVNLSPLATQIVKINYTNSMIKALKLYSQGNIFEYKLGHRKSWSKVFLFSQSVRQNASTVLWSSVHYPSKWSCAVLLFIQEHHLKTKLRHMASLKTLLLFSLALQPSAGYGLLVPEASWSHTTTRHSQ